MKIRLLENYFYKDIPEGTILEVIPGMEADAADVFNVPAGKCYLCKTPDNRLKYIIATHTEVVESSSVDWEQIRIQAAIAAMQGFASNSHNQCVDATTVTLAQWSVSSADALIRELKK